MKMFDPVVKVIRAGERFVTSCLFSELEEGDVVFTVRDGEVEVCSAPEIIKDEGDEEACLAFFDTGNSGWFPYEVKIMEECV